MGATDRIRQAIESSPEQIISMDESDVLALCDLADAARRGADGACPCQSCLDAAHVLARLDGEEAPGWLSTSEERQATDGTVIRREEDDR